MATLGEQDGKKALWFIENSEPVVWLAGHAHLSHQTRTALEYLYSLSKEYASQCPLPNLLTVNFDCEQIWQQLDLQSVPVLSSARRRLKYLQRNVNSVVLLDGLDNLVPASQPLCEDQDAQMPQGESESVKEQKDNAQVLCKDRDILEEENDISEAGSSGNSESEEDEGEHAVEDKFFKLKDMERFLDDAEAPQDSAVDLPHGSDTFEFDDDESEQEEDMDKKMEIDYMHEDDEEFLENKDTNLKYDDFFGGGSKKLLTETETGKLELLTAHEKQIAKVEKRIKELESANLNSTLWTMQGEVSAAKRPKNSALEVELDFEHNVRPPPVITEEVTASLEDLIRTRIAENRFDDVQRNTSMPLHVPKLQVELDEKKSQRGLAELYENDYMQKTGLAPVSSSPADEARKEATQLFKSLCVKLDALSHFHFTPKPVIEDMVVHPDVPALAMEEVAPMVVSDAQMLAPEEHFSGEGVVKTDAELSREEKKRRRARKKEKARAEKRKESHKKPSLPSLQLEETRGSLPSGKRRREQSQYSKSMKVFEQLDESKQKGKKVLAQSQDLKSFVFDWQLILTSS